VSERTRRPAGLGGHLAQGDRPDAGTTDDACGGSGELRATLGDIHELGH
jgi:hypothetical protein